MASRMERYYKNELENSGRSSRNKSLYEQIENLDGYSNIEGVASIDKIDEIDISKVKKMLENRENYKSRKKLKDLVETEKYEVKETPKILEEQKNYDINDILSKMKRSNDKKEKYRSLDEEQINTLKTLNKIEKPYNIEKEEEELKEIINTIVGNKELNELSNNDDVGLLDDLKSDTMVGNASSIKKIIEEEKELSEYEKTSEIDKSFYTSSFGFTQSDFEELKDINHKIKKSNKYIIVLLVTLVVIAGILAIFMILK